MTVYGLPSVCHALFWNTLYIFSLVEKTTLRDSYSDSDFTNEETEGDARPCPAPPCCRAAYWRSQESAGWAQTSTYCCGGRARQDAGKEPCNPPRPLDPTRCSWLLQHGGIRAFLRKARPHRLYLHAHSALPPSPLCCCPPPSPPPAPINHSVLCTRHTNELET